MVDRAAGVPRFYWMVALGGLAFEIIGCLAYLLQVRADPAAMTLDQRAVVLATPGWITAAYAVAVWVGLAGAVGLLLRRRWASVALFLSLVAVGIQFGGVLLVPALRDAMSSSELLGPILIFVVAYGLWQFSLVGRNKGWLR